MALLHYMALVALQLVAPLLVPGPTLPANVENLRCVRVGSRRCLPRLKLDR